MSNIPSLFDFQSEILRLGGKCLSCGKEFQYGDIAWYEHPGGVEVKESPNKLWVYFECRKCGYQTALWKIEKQLHLEREVLDEELKKEEEEGKDEAWDRIVPKEDDESG